MRPRDHFPPPVWTKSPWEGFHGGRPMTMAPRMVPNLPDEYPAGPRVHLGRFYEFDVCAYEEDEPKRGASTSEQRGAGTEARLAPPRPTFTVDAELGDEYAYEVRVY